MLSAQYSYFVHVYGLTIAEEVYLVLTFVELGTKLSKMLLLALGVLYVTRSQTLPAHTFHAGAWLPSIWAAPHAEA